MARSVSTIPKTTSKPASVKKSTPALTATTDVVTAPETTTVVTAPAPAPKKAKKATATAGATASTTAVAEPSTKEKKPKAKKVKAEPVVKTEETAATVEAPVEDGSVNKLNASIFDVIASIRKLEAEAKLLRAKCKSMLYASKKECNSSRKFIKAKKEAAQAEGGAVYKTSCQQLTESVCGLSKQMMSEMSVVKAKIGKFSSLHAEHVKFVRKQKKENRKRAPPAASIQPVQVDPKISKFMGTEPGVRLSRHDVFTAIRTHISANQCYVEGHGKKFIQPDAALAPLFVDVPADKRNEITHFNMQKYLKNYFIKD
jgi:hypothetical protein